MNKNQSTSQDKYLSTWILDMLDYLKNGLEIVSIFTPEKTMEEKQGYGFMCYFQVKKK